MPRPDILASGRPVVDFIAKASPRDIPRSIRRQLVEPKIATTTGHIYDLIGELKHADVPIIPSEGGGALNMAARMVPLSKSRVLLRTWVGDDDAGRMIINDANKRKKDGLDPDIVILSNVETPIGLVVPREIDGVKHRTIFSNESRGMQSVFSDTIKHPHQFRFAIVNSHGGPDWDTNLVKGTQKLKDNEIPYVITPGSSQMDAVRDRTDKRGYSVYKAIAGAEILSVDVGELRDLVQNIRGKQLLINENTSVGRLLQIAQAELKVKVIFATDGPKGAYAIDKDGSMIRANSAKDSGVANPVGAGDAFNAAAAIRYFEDETHDVKESIVYGSVNGAVAVESFGAHENCITREALDRRVEQTRPEVYALAA